MAPRACGCMFCAVSFERTPRGDFLSLVSWQRKLTVCHINLKGANPGACLNDGGKARAEACSDESVAVGSRSLGGARRKYMWFVFNYFVFFRR